MNTTQFISVFDAPLALSSRGVVGIVDDLLRSCPEHGIRLEWQADRCRIRSLAGASEAAIEVPLEKSVIRAILARMAALCNVRNPNSVSPYGGRGEISFGLDPPITFQVSFANTPDDQWLQLEPAEAPPTIRQIWKA